MPRRKPLAIAPFQAIPVHDQSAQLIGPYLNLLFSFFDFFTISSWFESMPGSQQLKIQQFPRQLKCLVAPE